MNQALGIVFFLGGIVLVVCGMFDFSLSSLSSTESGLLILKVITVSFALPAAIVGGIILRHPDRRP